MTVINYIEDEILNIEQKFIGVKIIKAQIMGLLQAQQVLGRTVGYEGLTNEDGDCSGYLVEYKQRDNAPAYRAWSPADVFQDAYRPIEQMTFGLAIEALKKGLMVSRTGWNGKGMWLFLMRGIDIQESMSSVYGDGENGLPICDSICMKTADDKVVVGWLASQTDILAEDWQITPNKAQ